MTENELMEKLSATVFDYLKSHSIHITENGKECSYHRKYLTHAVSCLEAIIHSFLVTAISSDNPPSNPSNN